MRRKNLTGLSFPQSVWSRVIQYEVEVHSVEDQPICLETVGALGGIACVAVLQYTIQGWHTQYHVSIYFTSATDPTIVKLNVVRMCSLGERDLCEL